MKTTTWLSLMGVCISVSLASAQKCKFSVEKKDPFTNEAVHIIYRSTSGLYWNSFKVGAKYQIEFSFNIAGEQRPPMTTKDSLLVKLADGTTMSWKPSADAPPVAGSYSTTSGRTGSTSSVSSRTTAVTSTTNYSTFKPIFVVSRDVFQKLAASPVVAVRVSFTGEPLDFDFTRKPILKIVDEIQQDAACILSLPD